MVKRSVLVVALLTALAGKVYAEPDAVDAIIPEEGCSTNSAIAGPCFDIQGRAVVRDGIPRFQVEGVSNEYQSPATFTGGTIKVVGVSIEKTQYLANELVVHGTTRADCAGDRPPAAGRSRKRASLGAATTDYRAPPTATEMRVRVRRYVDIHLEHLAARIDADELGRRERRRRKREPASRCARAFRRRRGPRRWRRPRPPEQTRNLVTWGLFLVVVGGVMFVLLDMDRPRRGTTTNDRSPYVRLRDSLSALPAGH